MSKVEKVIQCSVAKPIKQLERIPQSERTGWDTPPLSPKEDSKETPLSLKEVLQDTVEKPSEGQKNGEQQCSDEKEVADLRNKELKALHRRTEELNNLVNQRVEELKFESKKEELLNKIQELESQLKNLNKGGLSKDPSINIPSKEEKEEERKEEPHDIKSTTASPWTTVVNKGSSSTKKKISFPPKNVHSTILELSGDMQKNIGSLKEHGKKAPKNFLQKFIKEVSLALSQVKDAEVVHFNFYINARALKQLIYEAKKCGKLDTLLKYVTYFQPPKWYEICWVWTFHNDVPLQFFMTEQVKTNMGYTRMSPEDILTFKDYYADGWISFLDLTTGKVIPCEELSPLFGKLL